MKYPVLVTGATGFIGRHLVRRLLEAGYPVKALVRPRALHMKLPNGAQIFKGDVRFAETLQDAAEGCSAVFHLAARMSGADLEDYREVNVYGSEQVARAASRYGNNARIVFMSSVAAMGPRSGPANCGRTEADLNIPTDPYGLSKREAEQRLVEVCASESIGLDILRPGLVYGPGDRGWFPDLVMDVTAGRIHRMGNGQNRLGLIYIDHLIETSIALLQRPPSGEAFIAVDPEPPTLDVLLETLASVTGCPLPRRRWSEREARLRGFLYGILSKRTGQPTALTRSRVALLLSDQWFEGEQLRKHVGNLPLLPFEERIRRTVTWVLEHTR